MKIFTNGNMLYSRTSDNGVTYDSEGNPVAAVDGRQKKTRVFIDVITENRRGRYDDGRYSNVEYEVSLDYDDVPKGFNPSSISLMHDRKGDLGTFTVQRIEFYDLTRTIIIWV